MHLKIKLYIGQQDSFNREKLLSGHPRQLMKFPHSVCILNKQRELLKYGAERLFFYLLELYSSNNSTGFAPSIVVDRAF